MLTAPYRPNRMWLKLIAIAICMTVVSGRTGYGPGQQDWGFMEVREGVHLFYWLLYTTANVTHYTDRPLAIWLEDGPGISAAGSGYFIEFGPLNMDGMERQHNWVKRMNVLLIDSPVGSGFSYATNETLYCTTIKQVTSDLLNFMKMFYEQYAEFQAKPLHILSQSYGAKVAAELAYELQQAQQREQIKCNLQSVTLGSAFVSPIDSLQAYAPALLYSGLVDISDYERVNQCMQHASKLLEAEAWTAAVEYLMDKGLVRQLFHAMQYVSPFNVLKPAKACNFTQMELALADLEAINSAENLKVSDELKLLRHALYNCRYDAEGRNLKMEQLMNSLVSKALNISRPEKQWQWLNSKVHDTLMFDALKPNLHFINALLQHTNVQVNVLSGQADLVCPTAGTLQWVAKLEWPHSVEYKAAKRQRIIVSDYIEGFEKGYGNFNMYWVLRAGHSIPSDNPIAMSYILKKITGYD